MVRAAKGLSDCDERQGTTTLFAAVGITTELVKTGRYQSRRPREFLDFMNDAVAEQACREVHVILGSKIPCMCTI